MVAYKLRLDSSQLQGVGIGRARTLVDRVKRRTLNRSSILAPVDTGRLRASGRMERTVMIGTKVRSGVMYDAEYAAAVHNGRRALTIRARGGPKRRLRFVVNGRVVYARTVHQPARRARPFLSTALREVATQEGFRVSIG